MRRSPGSPSRHSTSTGHRGGPRRSIPEGAGRVAMSRSDCGPSRRAIGGERVPPEAVARALDGLVTSDDLVSRVGPAVNSGRPILLYGPPGNGKTSVAERIGSVFGSVIYVPHCFEVGGQIVKVFDPDIHRGASLSAAGDAGQGGSIRAAGIDPDSLG